MKKFVLAAAVLAVATPSYAQLGGLGGAINKAQQGKKAVDTADSLVITADEEYKIGQDVSAQVRTRFGVVQDPAIHKYVTLVGMAVAENAPKEQQPKNGWQFIVLDTDGVNAFAAPSGFVHITRGALAMLKNESELASVLGHEIGHVTKDHTKKAIETANREKAASGIVMKDRGEALKWLTDKVTQLVLDGMWSQSQELDADTVSTQLAPKAGYASTLDDFLKRLDERNKDVATRNALFASHPAMKERIEKLGKLDSAIKTTALVESRYKSSVKYELAAVTSIAVVAPGAAGLTGDSKDTKKEEPKKEEPKKGLGGLGTIKNSVAPEQKTAQVQNSGGSRGVGPDRDAKGGGNPAIVKVAVTAADVAAFKRGIA